MVGLLLLGKNKRKQKQQQNCVSERTFRALKASSVIPFSRFTFKTPIPYPESASTDQVTTNPIHCGLCVLSLSPSHISFTTIFRRPGLQAKSYHCNDNIKQAQPFFFLCFFFFSIQCPTHILLMPSTEQHFKQLLLCWCFVLAIPSLHSSQHGFSNMENHPNGFCCVPALLSLEGSPLFVSSWQDYPASWTTPGGLSAVFWLCQSGWQEAKSSLLLLCWSWIRPSFKTTGFVVEWRSATLLTFLSKNMKFNIGCSCVWSVSWRPWLFFTWGGGILWKWTFQTKWGVSVEEWV